MKKLLYCILSFTLYISSQAQTPQDFGVYANPSSICGSSGSSVITMPLSETGVNYTLRNNAGNAVIAGPVAGTGSAITFNTGILSSNTSFNVLAQRTSSTSSDALKFNGASAIVNVTGATNIPVADSMYTIEAWIKPSAFGSYGIVGWGNYGTGNQCNAFRLDGTGKLINYWWGNDLIVSAPGLTNGSWHHVAVTYDHTTRIIYMDGVVLGSDVPGSAVHAVTDASNLTIGRTLSGEFFSGSIDEVRIWKVARTQAELVANMNTCLTGTETGLELYYKMTEGTGTTLTDATPNNNTGTFSGFVLPAWTNGNGPCSANSSLVLSVKPTVTLNNTVLVNQTPTASTTLLCGTSGFSTITLPSSQLNTNYYVRNNSTNAIVSGPVSGTGSGLSLSTGLITAATTFNVYAQAMSTGISFTGAGTDYIGVSSTAGLSALGAGYTLEAWINPSDVSSVRSIIRKSGDYNLYLSGGTLHAEVWPTFGTSTMKISNGTIPIVANTWTHVAATWNGTNFQLYVNGMPDGAATVTSSGASVSESMSIGVSQTYAQPFAGSMDEIRIWNTANTATQIHTNMSACLLGSEAGLILDYRFEEGSGSTNVADAAGGDNNGNLIGMNPVSAWVNGIDNCATCSLLMSPTVSVAVSSSFSSLNFNGSSNYVNIGNAITGLSGYTKEAWVYATASSSNNILSSSHSPFWLAGGKLSAAHNWGVGGTVQISDPGTFPLNTWTHVAVTYDSASTTLSVYKNGVLVVSSNAAPAYVVEANQVGAYLASNYFAGDIDELRIWNVARTAAQISANMNTPISSPQTGLVSYYQFNQGIPNGNNTSITSITDISGANNTGTPVSFTMNGTSSNFVGDYVVPVISGNSTFCPGTTTTLTASAGTATSYTWVSGPATASYTMTPAASATFTVVSTNALGCSYSATQAITLQSAAVTTVPPANASVCTGGNTTFSIVASPVTSYLWQSSTNGVMWINLTNTGGYTTVNTSTLHLTAVALAKNGLKYRCRLTNTCGSIFSAFATLTVSNPPVVTISGTTGICSGTKTVLIAGGGSTYSWSPGLALTSNDTVSPVINSTYTVSVTNALGCTVNKTQLVSVFALPTATVSQTNENCSGDSNGSATVTASGGSGTYTYTWSPSGGTAASAPGLSAGTYTCTISDANACGNVQTVTITEPMALTVTPSQSAVSCNGGSDGNATATISGGTGTYTYNWTPSGGTAATASGLAAGSYTCSVTDANACPVAQTFVISEPTVLSAATSQINNLCNGATSASASVTGTGGTGTYTYSWAPLGGTAATASGLAAGSYTCTVTDANSCSLTKVFAITEPVLITATPSQTNESCNGGSSGSASVTVSGGTGTYTYNWTPSGGTAATASGLSAGTYTCTITDANSCSLTKAITITEPGSLAATSSQVNEACNGGSSGSASVTVSGGTGTYTYNWTPSGGTAATASGLSAGTYTCSISDANSCSLIKTVSITQPSLLTATTSQVNEACNGSSTGSATVSATGGTGSYTYAWTPSGGTAATANGLSAGTYTCSISDANSCSLIQTVSITQPSSLTATTSQVNEACNGANTGSASVTVSGGTGTYTYSWTPSGGTAATAGSLSAASYTCTIRDANACGLVKTVTITQPSALSATSSQVNEVCNGGSNGSASVTVGGGTGTYTYNWTPSGGTAATASGLSAGTYTCSISDANSCSLIKTVTIIQPAVVTATTSQVNEACNGSSTGSATVSATGGTGTYTYNWTPSGGTASTASGLSAGTYTCSISDANSCSLIKTVNITQPSLLTATTSQVNEACNGASSGSASVTVSGGTGTYTYNWTPSGGTAATASGLSAGTYTCSISDANSCSLIQTVNITQPSSLTATTSQVNEACNGASTGSATVSVIGGTGTYTYNWTPSGGTAATASGLSAGTYTCSISDANSCGLIQTVNITQPSSLTATTSQVNEACNGASSGIASVTVSGGTGTYTYNWTPSGGTAATANGLSAGTYTCSISDANSCSLIKTVNITEPSLLTATTSQVDEACNGANTANASVAASGGIGAYSYNWTPSGGTSATASGLSAGTYTCSISDANSCSLIKTLTITQPAAMTATASQVDEACNGANTGSASVTATGGTGSYTYNWTPSGGASASAGSLSAGTYTCTITDANACSFAKTIMISEPSALTATTTQVNEACNGASTGSLSAAVSGGTGSYTYSWIPSGGLAATANALSAGTYTCTITDANSCSTSAIASVSEPAALTYTAAVSPATCGQSNGSASIYAAGGTGALTYSWSPTGGNASTAANIPSGSYTCSITDANACSIAAATSVPNSNGPTVTMLSSANTLCYGSSNGSASVTVSSGTGAYTYSWIPSGGNAAAASNLSAGTYTCQVSDANGCIGAAGATILQPPALSGSSVQNDVTCSGAMNGNASLSVSGGSGTYTYSWSPSGGTAPAAVGLAGGMYTCFVTDANACATTFNISIAEPSLLVVQPGLFTDVSCNGFADGSASITTSGGTASYSYSWTPAGGSGAKALNLGAGIYTCTVTDANGCQAAAAGTISQPAAVTVALTSTATGACNGGADTLRAGGALTYTWMPSAGLNNSTGSEVIATIVANATYTVTGTDASGCAGVNTISLNLNPDPTVPVITSVGNVLSSSGTGNLYQWYLNGSPLAGATLHDYTALATGTYMVTETNGFGCSAASSGFVFTVTGSATSLADVKFRLYPNPSQSDVTLELPVMGQHAVISFYDMLGQLVKTVAVTDRFTTIHQKELSEGVYIYRLVRDGAQIGTGRLVIQ